LPEFSVFSFQSSGFRTRRADTGFRMAPGDVEGRNRNSNSELVWLVGFGYYLPMILDRIPALRELSWIEKLELVDELWRDVRADVSFDVRHEEIVAELERRRAEYASSPDSVVSWKDIKRRLAV